MSLLLLKRLTAILSTQGFQAGSVLDLTDCVLDPGAGGNVRIWGRTGPKNAFVADERPIPDAGLFRSDGLVHVTGLFEALAPSRAAPRVLAISQALASSATLAAFAHSDVDAFVVVPGEKATIDDWALIVRNAFDAGYFSLTDKSTLDDVGVPRLMIFLRSFLVQKVEGLGGLNRGVVTMATLGSNGRFANQLMQYAYVKLYGLRHGLRPTVPRWIGSDLYRLRSPEADGRNPAELRFFAFDNDDLHLWHVPDPPVDIDLWGYFQELPPCWAPHREFLRRLYTLPPTLARPLQRRLSKATNDGRRDLVAIHVRRGDYRTLYQQGLPWYRPIPEEWYAAWLRRLLPELRNPLVYVATDEPETILPAFAEFEPLGTGAFAVRGLAADVLDFEILRRAGHLAIANSSFSRMAAILASDTQVCVYPDFAEGSFVPYSPWIDAAFWSRFEAEPKAEAIMGYGPDAQGARAVAVRGELGRSRQEVLTLQSEIASLGKYVREREMALRDSEAANRELSRVLAERSSQNAEEIARWRAQVEELAGYLAQRDEALRAFATENRKLGEALDERSQAFAEELESRNRQIIELEEQLRRIEAEASELAQLIAERDRLSQDYELEKRLAQQAAERLQEERLLQVAALQAESDRQRLLARREQARVSALRATLDERSRENAALKAEIDDRLSESVALRIELDLMRPRLRLALAWDYLKHLFFWPIARLLRLAALLAKYRIPFVAERLNGLAGLIEQREYRKFAQGFGKSLSRVPRRLGKQLMLLGSTQFGHPAEALKGSGVEEAVALGPVQPDASTPATTYGETALLAPDGPVVLVLGSLSPDALAITMESLASQTLRPRDVRVSVEDFACGPGDLICTVAAGARIDPTSIELLAAVLLSAPLCKFAALTDAGEASIAACLMPSWIWRAHGRQALEIAPPEKTLDALGAAMTGVVGQGLVLPPLAVWASTPGIRSNILAWNAILATPDQVHVWSASPLDGAARLEAFIGLRTARDGREARPHLLIVVPWLPIGGSEIVLLEILEHVAERWAISIVTTLPSDHGMRPAFARLTDEIYHAGDVFDAFRLQAFVSGLITARSTRIVLSSNSGHLYRMVPELKAAHPQVAFVDILHNDLPNGHILNAVNAATSLERHVAVSRRVGEALIKRGVPRERVAVVPNGVDADLFSPQTCRSQARAAFKVEDETLVLAFVGRFSEEKRVDAFAEIVARVRRKMPVRAIVVGQGPGEAEFRARITAEDLPIEIIAKMPRFDLVKLYAAADVLVLTSTVEGMPMVVLEAMAAGCPAAVTNVGDLRRVIEPGVNGFLAPVDAPEMLADVIAAAASDPGRLSRMRTAAREAIISREMTKAAMLEGYDRLLNALGFDREGRTV